MISLLPIESLQKQVHSSLCVLGPVGGKERTNVKHQFCSTDLVALWMRAQFCSISRRYLRELYQVVPVDEEGNVLGVEGDSRPRSCKAVYKGNNRSKFRCFSEPPVVERLRE
jgi:hypothetical protein